MKALLILASLLETDVTLSGAQLAALGLATVAGSFALNGVLLSRFFRDRDDRLGALERAITGPDGVLVKIARIETTLDERDAPRSLSPHDVGALRP